MPPPLRALDPEEKTDPNIAVPGRSFPVPWGLLVALGLYAVGMLGYVWMAYWSSPDYQAAKHWEAASELLGGDGGRTASREALVEAYSHLLEAGRLKPQVKTFHDEAESLNWRFEERHWKLPEELRHRADANAVLWQRIQKRNEPILVVGLRDRGWTPEELIEGPTRVAIWSPVGAVFIGVIWGYLRMSARRVRALQKEQELREMEQQIRQLGAARRRGR